LPLASRTLRWLLAACLLTIGLLAVPGAGEDQPPTAPAADLEEVAPDPLVQESSELAAAFEELLDKIGRLRAEVERAEGEAERVLEERLWRLQLDSIARLGALVDNVIAREARGDDVSALRKVLAADLQVLERRIPAHVKWRKERIAKLRSSRDAATGAEATSLDTQLLDQEQRLQRAYRAVLDLSTSFEKVDLDTSSLQDFAAHELTERAESQGDWISILRQERSVLAKQAKSTPDDVELQSQVEQLSRRLDRATDRLSATIALLAKLDVPTAQYQQLLIETTGQITADILDKDVLLGLIESWQEQTVDAVASRGPSWLVRGLIFVLILAAFRVLAALSRRIASRTLHSDKANVSQLLRDTLIAWSSRVMMGIGVLVALSQLGVQIGPLLAGLGIAGFIVGFALQDSLANFAAGAMILVYRPFDVGDVIEAATVSGKVSAMSLVSTTIHTFDNQTLIVPNNRIWGDVIRNVTAQSIRRVDLVVGVGYAEDVEHVERILHDVVAKHPKTLDDPEPMVKLHKLGESGVEFVVRPWALTQDYWNVYWDLTREVKLRFDREGIRIPYPQRDVHVRSTPADEA